MGVTVALSKHIKSTGQAEVFPLPDLVYWERPLRKHSAKKISWWLGALTGAFVSSGLGLVALSGTVYAAQAVSPSATKEGTDSKPPKPFAVIGDVEIDPQTFFEAVRVGIRQKFYHGAIPLDKRSVFQREVGSNLVDHVLLVKEAKRLKMTPEQAKIDENVANYEKKQEKNPEWQAQRATLLPVLIQQLQEQSLAKQLQANVRAIPEPSLDAIQGYYKAHPEKFTEPMDQKVSVILIAVDPSSGGEAWKNALAKAQELAKQLKEGADFAEMATNHSDDASASQGGKMEYSHKGMLAPEAEKALEKLAVGGFTEPIMVLEGVAIFHLDGRTPPKLVSFQNAQKRARLLLMREMADQAWETLKKRLREQTPAIINEEYYLPLPKSAADTTHPVVAPSGVKDAGKKGVKAP